MVEMKVAVTGASGHVGVNLVSKLLSSGFNVRALVHRSMLGLENLDCEIVRIDVLNKESLIEALRGVEVVIHTAAAITVAKGKPEHVWRVNVEGTRNLLEAMERNRVGKLIYFSSIHAFDYKSCDVITESTDLIGGNNYPVYDRSKAEATKIVKSFRERHDCNVNIVYPTAIIGPADWKPSFIGRFLLSLYRGHIPALVRGGFDWVDVRDIVEYTVRLVSKDYRSQAFIFSGEFLSIQELAQLWGEIGKVRVPGICLPVFLAESGGFFNEIWCRIFDMKEPIFTRESIRALKWKNRIDNRKTVEILGYKPTPIRKTLEDLFKWFRDKGFIGERSYY